MGGSRRTHTKSRNGCSQCKKRRKKCDQRPPHCENCRKWSIRCDFEEYFKPELLVSESSRTIAQERRRLSFVPEPQPIGLLGAEESGAALESVRKKGVELLADGLPLPLSNALQRSPRLGRLSSLLSGVYFATEALKYQEIKLLHQYFNVTSLTLSPMLERQHFWRNFVLSQAKSNQYVMHVLLSFSALHLASVYPEDCSKYYSLAASHQYRGISGFRHQVDRLDRSNQDPVSSFSSLLVLNELGFMSLSCMIHDTPWDAIGKLLQQFLLIKKVLPVLQAFNCQESQVNVNIQDMLRIPNMATVSPTVLYVLELVDSVNWRTAVNPRQRQIYSQALHEIHMSYFLMISKPSEWSTMLYWTMHMSLEYIGLLHDRHHMALVILGCYCTLVRHAPARWWMQYWNEQVLEAISQLLGEKWHAIRDILEAQQDLGHVSRLEINAAMQGLSESFEQKGPLRYPPIGVNFGIFT